MYIFIFFWLGSVILWTYYYIILNWPYCSVLKNLIKLLLQHSKFTMLQKLRTIPHKRIQFLKIKFLVFSLFRTSVGVLQELGLHNNLIFEISFADVRSFCFLILSNFNFYFKFGDTIARGHQWEVTVIDEHNTNFVSNPSI